VATPASCTDTELVGSGYEGQLGDFFLRVDLLFGTTQSLTIDLSTPVPLVSGELWDIDDNVIDEDMRVTAYDSGGGVLATLDTPAGFAGDGIPWAWSFDESAGIAKIVISKNGHINYPGLGVDNLVFDNPIPEPATLSLLAMGAIGLVAGRKRK